ncbi:MAG TPA: hypothetical protein VGM77_12680 [Gemmatimonadales bacterium]|jgi:hypothetical protein
MMMRIAPWLALLAGVPIAARAQLQVTTNSTLTPMGRAMMAERNGEYADAAAQYQAVLAKQPANLAALAGLEHVLPKLDRRADLVQAVQAAYRADSTSIGIMGVAVRTFAAMGATDSAARYADRWSARASGDEEPYREWSEAALELRDMAQARIAIDAGRKRLGGHALGLERAELLQRAGDIAAAAAEWVGVVRETPAFRDGAVGVLAQVPVTQRNVVRAVLEKDGSPDARQMLGLLLAQWGDPAGGLASLHGALPADTTAAVLLLRRFYDALRNHQDKPSQLALAGALELLAAREGASNSPRDLMEAAHSYADAGDERNARRLLDQVARTPGGAPGNSTMAATALLGVMIAEGKSAEAERALAALGTHVDADEHDRLARRIAMSWVRQGDFARADQVIAHDSSTTAFDLRGRLRLYLGDLSGANDLLKYAGPYDDDRELALERVRLLTLIQAVGQDSVPALGAACLAVARGDTAAGVRDLTALAATLTANGAAEVRTTAARLAIARGDTTAAVALWHAADGKDAPAAAAAARLALAEVAAARGQIADAATLLESLLVDFPDSALAPDARHLRDTLHISVKGE